MSNDAIIKDMKSTLIRMNETYDIEEPSDSIESGESIPDPENYISLEMDNYDFYRLGLLLASEKMYDASQSVSSTDKKLLFYSEEELELTKKVLSKHGVKYTVNKN